jgi:hypothetical protein
MPATLWSAAISAAFFFSFLADLLERHPDLLLRESRANR